MFGYIGEGDTSLYIPEEEFLMFESIQSFVHEWKHESNITQNLLNQLTDASLAQAVSEKDRTLGELAWHIADSIWYMSAAIGLKFEGVKLSGETPTAEEIKAGYRENSERFITALEQQWSNASLSEKHPIFGMEWTGAEFLYSVVKHEVHHRGQVSVLMRQAGLKVTDIYGPARQD